MPVEIIELEAPAQFAGVEIPGPDETLDPEPLIPVPPLQRKGDGIDYGVDIETLPVWIGVRLR